MCVLFSQVPNIMAYLTFLNSYSARYPATVKSGTA